MANETNENTTKKTNENTTKKTNATVNPADEREDIFVPKGYANDEPNLLIAVNGVNYLLPRGKTSNVPKFIAEEFHRSQKAQEALDKRVDEMLEASKY